MKLKCVLHFFTCPICYRVWQARAPLCEMGCRYVSFEPVHPAVCVQYLNINLRFYSGLLFQQTRCSTDSINHRCEPRLWDSIPCNFPAAAPVVSQRSCGLQHGPSCVRMALLSTACSTLCPPPTCQRMPKRTAISHIPHQSATLGGSDYGELCSLCASRHTQHRSRGLILCGRPCRCAAQRTAWHCCSAATRTASSHRPR